MLKVAIRDIMTNLKPIEDMRQSRYLAAVAGMLGVAAVTERVNAQADPTPTEGIGGIAPQPSPTQPSSVPPTPTMGVIAPPPSPTPTSEPDPVGPSPTPPSWPEPTATQPVLAQPEQNGDDEIPFCPYPYNPFNWFCWPGSGGRWFPVVPPQEIVQQNGVSAYGLRAKDPSDPDWQMEAIAWDAEGREMASLRLNIDSESYVGTFVGGNREVAVSLTPRTISDGTTRIEGMVNGSAFEVASGQRDDEQVNASSAAFEIDDVVLVWSPLFDDVGGLLGIPQPDGGELEGPWGCVSGLFGALFKCFNALIALGSADIVTFFICDDAFNDAFSAC